MIKTFSQFLTESEEDMKSQHDTAGIAIIYDGRILLVHPTNGSWVKPIMGIPKGKINQGEEVMAAAIRETFEETGIKIEPAQLEITPQAVQVHDGSGKYKNTIHYFICRLQNLDQIGLSAMTIPKNQLQKEEVDWAGFIEIKQAYAKVATAQRIILDRLS